MIYPFTPVRDRVKRRRRLYSRSRLFIVQVQAQWRLSYLTSVRVSRYGYDRFIALALIFADTAPLPERHECSGTAACEAHRVAQRERHDPSTDPGRGSGSSNDSQTYSGTCTAAKAQASDTHDLSSCWTFYRT